jgi:hypothetical protein
MRKRYSESLDAKTYIDNCFDDVWKDTNKLKMAITVLTVTTILLNQKVLVELGKNIIKFFKK